MDVTNPKLINKVDPASSYQVKQIEKVKGNCGKMKTRESFRPLG